MPEGSRDESIRDALRRIQGGRTIRAFAAELGVSKSMLHLFLAGQREIDLDPVYRALYRTHPELRWQLEEYQRRAALATNDAQPMGEPAATGPPGPRS